jgi:hypothetical protein
MIDEPGKPAIRSGDVKDAVIGALFLYSDFIAGLSGKGQHLQNLACLNRNKLCHFLFQLFHPFGVLGVTFKHFFDFLYAIHPSPSLSPPALKLPA